MPKPLSVAQVVCVLPPYGGGIGMVAHAYADQLAEKGFNSAVFTVKDRRFGFADSRYRVCGLKPWLKNGNAAVLPQLLWRLTGFDVIQLHYPFFGASLWCALVKVIKGKRVKFIINYHMDYEVGGWRGLVVKIARTFFEKFIFNRADKIICSSEDYLANSVIQEYYYQHLSKFATLPFGVPRIYRPASKNPEFLARYGFTAEDKIVLFVGGLDKAHYFKGVNYLIKAFTLLKKMPVKCLLVGDGDLATDYRAQVKEADLTEKIKFAGYVPSSELVDHFNLADFVILPSINKAEAFGIVLLEGMACGKPLIASNLKGVRTVLEPGINGLLTEPKNYRDIADKITCYLQHPDMAETFSRNGLKLIEEKYRWSKIVEKLIKLYT